MTMKGETQYFEDCCDFFMFKFELLGYYAKVLHGGSWFILDHFLAFCKWKLFFELSSPTLSSITIWIRFSKLSVEFYISYILPQLVAKIGLVLNIDPYTFYGDKGKYATICVQINPNHPLIKTICISEFKQPNIYKGVIEHFPLLDNFYFVS